MRLYRFRPLTDDGRVEWVSQTLRRGKFWCSKFWELNDPMEGVFHFQRERLSKQTRAELYDHKAAHVTCSFSDRWALRNPLMWGYYAGGFRGVAIEIKPDTDQFRKIVYSKTLPELDELNANAETVLLNKLSRWKHEREWRFMKRHYEAENQSISQPTAVYIGSPYHVVENADAVRDRDDLADYLGRARQIQFLAERLRIPCWSVWMSQGKVCMAKIGM